jgi:hypothetical protein
MGSEDDVIDVFRPFAKQKRNDFWVWELLAEMNVDNPTVQFSCYCKALSLRTKEDFLVKLRQTFAEILISKGLFQEAKNEIQIVMETRMNNQWKIPSIMLQWTDQDWYRQATGSGNNQSFYEQHIKEAEEVLYADVPEQLVVIEFVNEGKHICNFIHNKNLQGFFKYNSSMGKPQIGDIYRVRFVQGSADGYFKLLTANRQDKDTPTEAIRTYNGILKIKQKANLGFVDDVFISQDLLKASGMPDGSNVKGRAMLSYNKKREEWGWKAIDLAMAV